jgi:hypothetical protein
MSIKKFKENLPYLEDNEYYIKAHLYLGVAYFAKNNKKKTREELELVLSLDPEYKISEKEFSPKIVAEFFQIKNKKNKLSKNLLKINTDPSLSLIFLNGKKIERNIYLIEGKYFLSVVANGYNRWYKVIDITTDSLVLDIKLNKDTEKESNYLKVVSDPQNVSLDTIDFLVKEAKKAHSDILFLGTLKEEERENYILEGQLFDSVSHDFSKIFKSNFSKNNNNLLNLGKFLANCIEENGKFNDLCEQKELKEEFITPKNIDTSYKGELLISHKPFYKNKWVWLTAGIIFAGVTSYFLIESLNNEKVQLPEYGVITIKFP